MTPETFRAHLSRLGYTQAGFGKEVDVGERTVRRWATDENAQIPKAIQMLLEGKKLPRRVK
jgi:hypothetical protein